MTHYLIEFRFQGRANKEIKRLVWEVNKRFHIRPKNRPVPHITIIAPFHTINQKRLVKEFKETCEKYDIVNFKVEGYGCFKDSRVVYIDINPSEGMKNLRMDLLKKLKKYCKICDTDLNKPYSPHATIAMKLSHDKFKKIKNYINKKKEQSQKYVLVRITLIKNSRILCQGFWRKPHTLVCG
ncbi:MAG TPA: 2'-5' RNA ligase family protein [Candidatus Pacearchaeota archaeon]|nr:2',5' RNA ligase family [archaeon BMS3Abin17]HDK42179.1 2'-5' RNA ligase family protein [Candidatus Pacearchaeota archaeon]HDZ60238.1 2'-5' RNA ligase family protein [Candidatus Pacearchaeota archaeon]